jgi:membrane protein YdbS with pleckstrin-like domain
VTDIVTGLFLLRDFMGYVEDHLMPGEEIVHRARLHKIVYLTPLLVAIAVILAAVPAFATDRFTWAAVALALALVPLIYAQIRYSSSEFAVTNKRVIIKVGFIQRRTLETLLSKVEGIEVHQSVLGRMIDSGTIVVTGTGGTREQFSNIAAPLEFRRQVQAQVTSSETMHGIAAPGVPRDERECPYCAELILKRAKLCKHCGKDVEPLPV